MLHQIMHILRGKNKLWIKSFRKREQFYGIKHNDSLRKRLCSLIKRTIDSKCRSWFCCWLIAIVQNTDHGHRWAACVSSSFKFRFSFDKYNKSNTQLARNIPLQRISAPVRYNYLEPLSWKIIKIELHHFFIVRKICHDQTLATILCKMNLKNKKPSMGGRFDLRARARDHCLLDSTAFGRFRSDRINFNCLALCCWIFNGSRAIHSNN